MVSSACEPSVYVRDTVCSSVKLLVVGPFAVGKTTLVNSVSEIEPLRTEETMTQAGASVDDLTGVPDKSRTTVAMDFGRITLSDQLVLYLFGAPGQERFLPLLWEDLTFGATGALVMADTRRLDQSFDVMDLLEEQGLPYAVAVNRFPDTPAIPDDELRKALDLRPDTPLITCDARSRSSAATTLLALVRYCLTRLQEPH